MAELILSFAFEVAGPDGAVYHPRVCGRERDDGLWEGWLEFVAQDGTGVLRTGRETTQPNRRDLDYWATGLSPAYLDGALLRLLRPPANVHVDTGERPAFEAPAPNWPEGEIQAMPRVAMRSALDPFAVYAEGDEVLRQQLTALDAGQLRNMILAHHLSAEDAASLERRGRAELMAIVLERVRELARP